MEVTSPVPRAPSEVARPRRPAAPSAAASVPVAWRVLARVGLCAIVLGAVLLVAFAASEPTVYVPASIRGGFPGWLSGPLHGLRLGRLSNDRFQDVLILMSIGYGLVLVGAQSLSLRAVLIAVGLANLALFLGPPLLSQDVFGYLSFARLAVVHGLDPYNHASAAVPGDAVYRYLGWRTVDSPYGPLYTIGSFVLAPLGVAGGLWALKAIAVSTCFAAIAIVGRAAQILGRPAAAAAAFVGLNPVLLVDAVGGFHNDTLLLLLFAAMLLFAATARYGRAMAALIVAVGIKLSAGLVVPFLILAPQHMRERRRLAAIALSGLCAIVILAAIAFGSHAFAFINSIQGEQNMVATHSVPNELARLVGLPTIYSLPTWWRDLFIAGLVAATATSLWWTWRGGDWRVGAGWVTVALLVSTAWLLPWYIIWLLPFAALVPDRRLKAASLALTAYAVLIRLPLASSLLGGRRS